MRKKILTCDELNLPEGTSVVCGSIYGKDMAIGLPTYNVNQSGILQLIVDQYVGDRERRGVKDVE